MENLTETLKNKFFANNADLAQFLGLDYVETTTGMNGYPEHIQNAIISESIETLLETQTALEDAGYEVEQLYLHKKDGWNLWNRTNTYIQKGQMCIELGQDWTFDFDSDEEESTIKEKIFTELFAYHELLADDEDFRAYQKIKELASHVDFFYNQLPSNEGNVKVFYNPNADYTIDYWVSENSAAYYNDTNHYQLAIRVVNLNLEEIED